MAPPRPESRFHCLPPILRKLTRESVSSCSKGSWGLSVLPRVEGIFTPDTISLSPWSRQRGCCYAIRAGRNLPDKEFRYLRTVIVTAAVYRGFGSKLRASTRLTLTSPLNLPAPGRRQCVYGALCGLAHTCVFAKQSLGPIHCDLAERGARSSSRTPAHLLPKLRCHFAEFLNQGSLTRLGILTPPT